MVNTASGPEFEKIIESTINRRYNLDSITLPSYQRNVHIGYTIYGTRRFVDYLLKNTKFPDGLVIECKFQGVTGTVDEKYPFLLECIKLTAIPTIICTGGNGIRKGAIHWLKQRVNTKEHPLLLGVYHDLEFMQAVAKGILE